MNVIIISFCFAYTTASYVASTLHYHRSTSVPFLSQQRHIQACCKLYFVCWCSCLSDSQVFSFNGACRQCCFEPMKKFSRD
uniref:Putative secreted protein n=1 Tax=Anopheles marajoara TaxID=58244 RepID=A0A2M4CBK4_9DIPT